MVVLAHPVEDDLGLLHPSGTRASSSGRKAAIFSFLEPYFFIGYLISIALFGLY
jgi:hypothetical protein